MCSASLFFQFTFMERESFPTGIDTFKISAIFVKACTPRTKSPFSSAVLVELIQLAEKLILFKASCFTPHRFVIASANAMRHEASGFSIAMFGFSPIEMTWPELVP